MTVTITSKGLCDDTAIVAFAAKNRGTRNDYDVVSAFVCKRLYDQYLTSLASKKELCHGSPQVTTVRLLCGISIHDGLSCAFDLHTTIPL